MRQKHQVRHEPISFRSTTLAKSESAWLRPAELGVVAKLQALVYDTLPPTTAVFYHWRELPQLSFLSRQKFCRDKHVLSRQKYFVATKIFRRDKGFVATSILLPRQTRDCRDKSKLVFEATKNYFCRDKDVIGPTKIILVAAPANVLSCLRFASPLNVLPN